MTEKEVVVQNLTKKFGETIAVDNVSFEVNKGELFVLIGPSPCGKSTVLRCIAGLEKPDGGSISIEGRDMTDVPAHGRSISLVFQNYALFPHMRVGENIGFGLKMRGLPKGEFDDRLNEVMKLVGLKGLEDRYPRQLSGGQQQRVALARSLVVRPNILLLDEPLGNLDYKLQQRMQVELKLLHEKLGLTFIHVTHIREQAMSLADRIAIMNRGIIEQIGSPSELYNSPSSVFVARFVGEINMLTGKVESLRANKAVVATGAGRFEGALAGRQLEREELVYAIRPERITIGPEARTCENTVEANFVDQIYKGSDAIYMARLSNGAEFRVLKQGHGIVPLRVTRGEKVMLGWNSENALLLDKPSVVPGVDMNSAMGIA